MKMKRQKKKMFPIKFCISCLIVLSAIILKFYLPQVSEEISKAVNGDIDYKIAVSAIGDYARGEGEIIEVYEETPISYEVVYKPDVTDEVSVEVLSFQMSEEELHDDTKAEPFRIPPPSYCSYEKVAINFDYTVPVHGKITSKYGYRDHPIIEDASFHTGIDIAAKSGTSVLSFAEGVVVDARYNDTYGNYVLIKHSGGIHSFYGHNSKLNVKTGAKVKKGQKIAEVGTTGLSTGPHLHFEVRNGTKRLDPTHYLKIEDI